MAFYPIIVFSLLQPWHHSICMVSFMLILFLWFTMAFYPSISCVYMFTHCTTMASQYMFGKCYGYIIIIVYHGFLSYDMCLFTLYNNGLTAITSFELDVNVSDRCK